MRSRLLAASITLSALALAGCGSYRKSGDRWVFVTVDEGHGRARDGRFHYYGPMAVAGADYASFKALGECYAKDRTHVFYKHQPVPGADPETFVADHGFGKDRTHHYAGTLVLGAR